MPLLVVFASASGRFGRCFVQELLKKPDVLIRGLVSDRSKAAAAIRSSPIFELLEGDVTDSDTLRQLFKRADVFISALMGSDSFMFEVEKQLIDLSEEAKVPRFIASDYTLDYTKLDNIIKGVHVLIGAFLDTFWIQWFGNHNYENLSQPRSEVTSHENLADFIVEVALNKNITVVGGTTIRGIAGIFEEASGHKLSHKQLGSPGNPKAAIDSTKSDEELMTWLPFDLMSYPPLRHRGVKDYLQNHSEETLATATLVVGD